MAEDRELLRVLEARTDETMEMLVNVTAAFCRLLAGDLGWTDGDIARFLRDRAAEVRRYNPGHAEAGGNSVVAEKFERMADIIGDSRR